MKNQERETLEVDVLLVGAGPSSLSCAIHLGQLAQENHQEIPTMAIVEKGSEVGSHQLSGAVLNPSALEELFPTFLEKGCPVESKVTKEKVYFLTSQRSFPLPITPPQMRNHGNYVVSLSKFTRWLGEQASSFGINIFPSFAATEVLIENHRVVGITTGDKGLNGKRNKKESFEPGMNIKAKCTVFGEGVRGFLTKQLISQLSLNQGKHPQTFETGVKEIWEVPHCPIEPGQVIHTFGYPISRDTVGGSFLYGMKDNLISLGLVISLNYENPWLEPYQELQKLKNHPLFAKWLKGGKQVAYGGKAISSGGYYSLPQLFFDGGLIIGEGGSLLDISRLKGIHMGMKSGILAAKVVYETLRQNKEFSQENLQSYQNNLLKSREGKDLYKARNYHQALSEGLPKAFFHLGFQQISRGRGIIDPMNVKEDREHFTVLAKEKTPAPLSPNMALSIDKLTSVYNSGTVHEEDQPCHLKIGDFQKCYEVCGSKFQHPCTRFCPAKVYEMVEEDKKQRLQINFTNCLHCQTCDIKCPLDNIRWTPPEAGGGPQYRIL